jgi:hypothetical protein
MELARLMFYKLPLKMDLGVAYVHPRDQYCKKTGVAVAKKKMKTYDYYVTGIRAEYNTEGDRVVRAWLTSEDVSHGVILEMNTTTNKFNLTFHVYNSEVLRG